MLKLEHGPALNLEHLRRQLTSHLALLLAAACGLVILDALPRDDMPVRGFALLTLLALLGGLVRRAQVGWPEAARHLLLWGVLGGVLASMVLFADPWLPFLGPLLAFSTAMLLPGTELWAAGVVLAVAGFLNLYGFRSYPLRELALVLALSAVLGKAVGHTLYTALGWAWTMQQRADRLLEETRSRRAELSRTLKSLELAYALQKRMGEELVAARHRAEEARRAKEQFAANISHELRTPLNLILGFSELMHRSPEVYGDFAWPPTLREDVHQIYQNSSHLLGMIDDILDLARFEMAGFTLRRELTSIADLVRDTANIAQDLFRGRPVALQVEIEPDLPALEIDRTRIRQVLINLLNNAQRFTTEGSIVIAARREGGLVVVSVSDTGTGIPADKLPRIFDQFYQIDQSLTRAQQGAGLGLAICKRFVEAHEGRIWVESQVGVGSTFYFSLPVPGQPAPAPQLRYAESMPAAAAVRPMLLLVDGDHALAGLLRRYLGEVEIIQVAEGMQVAEALAAYSARAVVWNRLPGAKPIDLPPGLPLPVIECSLPSHSWVAEDLGVAGYLTKPVTAEQLLRFVSQTTARDILVIDDDQGFAQLVQRVLQVANVSVHVSQAWDGAAGLEDMRTQPPDLVLLDLMMPEMDGFQLLEAMRRDDALRSIPVVLLTATNLAEDVLQRSHGQLTLRRACGLGLAETLRCLKALLEALGPAELAD